MPPMLDPLSEFANATQAGDELLRALFARAPVRSFPKNTILIGEGDRDTDWVYLIHSGKVKIYLCSADGKEIDLEVLEQGEYFGDMELDGEPRSASVATLERSMLAAVRQSEFRQLVWSNHGFALQSLFRSIARTRALLRNVKSLALLDVSERVARLLLELATEENGKLIITEKLSKRDIANRVGSTREMASRVFKDLVSSGFIELDHKRITIARPLPQHW